MNINFNSVITTLAAKAKALALNVSEIELKVLDATNEEAWGPHGKDMQEIARAAEDPEKYNLIMNVISERLQMREENWRLCYKALLLLEFLVKHGPWRVVDELNRSVTSLERLRDDFEYKDAHGRDQGINVRQRAGELASLVSNVDRVRQEREKASRNAGKYRGLSSADARGGIGSFGGGSGSNFGSSGGGGGGYGFSGFGGGIPSGAGSKAQQGFGNTESVHMPSGHSNRSGFGNTPAAGSFGHTAAPAPRVEGGFRSLAAGTGEEPEDPFEATRKRIERLKAEGALPEAAPGAPPPGLLDVSSAGSKAPKKLSEIKINPAVAATFANISIPASSSTSSLGKLAPPPAASNLIGMQQQGSDNSVDLFSGSSDPRPSVPQQQGGAAATDSAWDAAFGSAAPSSAAADDPFGSFPSAPAPAPVALVAPVAAAGLESLFGSAPTTSSQSAAAHVRAALPLDAFSELSASPAAGPPAAAGNSTTSADPFAALASSSSLASAPTSASATAISRPTPATAADPFAALSAYRGTAPPVAMAPPKPAAAPLAFDAFGAAPPAARTPQPAATQHTPAADPFAALASSSAAEAPPPAARPSQPPAMTFDPFASASTAMAPATAKPAAAAFDAFGMSAPPAPAPAANAFGDFFGTSSGQNGQSAPAGRPAGGDLFAEAPSFAPFAAPGAARGPGVAASGGANGSAMAMNKGSAAHGASGHKSADPFAGLGF